MKKHSKPLQESIKLLFNSFYFLLLMSFRFIYPWLDLFQVSMRRRRKIYSQTSLSLSQSNLNKCVKNDTLCDTNYALIRFV